MYNTIDMNWLFYIIQCNIYSHCEFIDWIHCSQHWSNTTSICVIIIKLQVRSREWAHQQGGIASGVHLGLRNKKELDLWLGVIMPQDPACWCSVHVNSCLCITSQCLQRCDALGCAALWYTRAWIDMKDDWLWMQKNSKCHSLQVKNPI